MTYNTYNIADEIKVMNLCQEIVNIDREIEQLRLKIGKLQDKKAECNADIDRVREAARARDKVVSLDTGTLPLAPPPPPVP